MKNDIILRGIAASPGIETGSAYLYEESGIYYTPSAEQIEDISREIECFKDAIKKSKEELVDIKEKLSKKLGFTKANFLDAQILALEDQWIIDKTISKIKEQKIEAAQAVMEISKELLEKFKEIDNDYLKERATDIKDVSKRVLKNLTGSEDKKSSFPDTKFILIAKDLTPSDTAQLEKTNVLAFLTDLGGKTSHTAIMARALDIPAVVGLKNISEKIDYGIKTIVDGYAGVVVLNPTEATLKNYEKKRIHFEHIEEELLDLKDMPATTVDGHTIDLSANIEFTEDIESAKKHGASGIGLYRTEFLYLTQMELPDEDTQYAVYKKAVDNFYPETVIFRTLDVGGDKVIKNALPERNPFLGWRAIRFLLKRKDVFKTQIRAILRASSRKTARIMFPMITDIQELKEIKELLEETKGELDKEGIEFDHDIEIGIMVEVPSVAILVDNFAKEADFFSIGSNDLTQYILAVDRTNELVASLYDHLHPAVLKTIKTIIDSAHRNNKWVGVCGEIAGDPLAIPVLLGLGIDELSAVPIVVPEIKQIIRTLSMKESKEIARRCLTLSTSREVRNYLTKIVNMKLPAIKELIVGNMEPLMSEQEK
jgi:phosphotransferase system enzyme I (PtsI)